MFHKPIDCAYEVMLVNPRYILPPIPGIPTKAATRESEQPCKDSTEIRTHHHRGAHENFSRTRGRDTVGRTFPCCGDIDTKLPAVRGAGFGAAYDAGNFV